MYIDIEMQKLLWKDEIQTGKSRKKKFYDIWTDIKQLIFKTLKYFRNCIPYQIVLKHLIIIKILSQIPLTRVLLIKQEIIHGVSDELTCNMQRFGSYFIAV